MVKRAGIDLDARLAATEAAIRQRDVAADDIVAGRVGQSRARWWRRRCSSRN